MTRVFPERAEEVCVAFVWRKSVVVCMVVVVSRLCGVGVGYDFCDRHNCDSSLLLCVCWQFAEADGRAEMKDRNRNESRQCADSSQLPGKRCT